MDHESLKIGRLSRAVEKALPLSPSEGDVNIYMDKKSLNQLANEKPDGYLRRIEEISNIIKHPHYVRFDEANDNLLYMREYIINGSFVKIGVFLKHAGRPKLWRFSRFSILSPEELKRLQLEAPFRPLSA